MPSCAQVMVSDQLVQRPEASRKRDERVRELVHERLALVQGLDDVEPRQPTVSHLALLEAARDDPGHPAVRGERGVGDDTHQPDLAAAGDELDRPGGKLAAERVCRRRIHRVVPGGRPAEDADAGSLAPSRSPSRVARRARSS